MHSPFPSIRAFILVLLFFHLCALPTAPVVLKVYIYIPLVLLPLFLSSLLGKSSAYKYLYPSTLLLVLVGSVWITAMVYVCTFAVFGLVYEGVSE
jgi:hydrogenase-4 membrane subunit HyfE